MNDKHDPFGSAAELMQKLVETAKSALPDELSSDIRNNVKAALQDVLSDLDMVPREEFEIQRKVLAKTRSKVDELEKLLTELEGQLEKE